MTRKNAAAVYFTEELENEIQERGLQHIFLSKIMDKGRCDEKNWLSAENRIVWTQGRRLLAFMQEQGLQQSACYRQLWESLHVSLHVCCAHGNWWLPLIDISKCVHLRTKGRISILWRTSPAVGKTPDPHQKRRLSEIPRMCR